MPLIQYSADDVRAAIPMPAAIDAVRQCFLDNTAGQFEMPLRTVLADGGFLVMTAFHRPSRSTMVKTISLNFTSRTPAIMGTVTWCDLESDVQVVADAGAVTALRTGAVSGVATDLLAPANASTCVVIGAGPQGIEQARAVHAVRPLTELVMVSRSRDRAEAACEALATELGGATQISASTDSFAAVEGKDVVCCATPSGEFLFAPEALGPRTHVNAIGSYRPSMREVPIETLAGAYVVVDDLPAVLEEAGEVIDALAANIITTDELYDLGQQLSNAPKRTGQTVFKSVGVAIQDWAIADALAHRAQVLVRI